MRPVLALAALCLAALCLAAATASSAQEARTASDGVPIYPVHVNDEGHGILRYSDPEGREIPLTAAIGAMVPDGSRPFEVIRTLGTWTGPDLSLCLQYLTADRVERMNMGVQIHAPAEEAVVARYEIVFDAERAEEIVSAEGGTGPGECESEFLR